MPIGDVVEHPTPPPVDNKPASAEAGSSPAKKPEAPNRTFSRREFVREGIGAKDAPTKKEIVTFTPELEREYVYFLKNYVTNFSNALMINPALSQNENARADIALVNALTENGTLSDAKISSFLRSSHGWIAATETIGRYAFSVQSVLGYEVDGKPARSSDSELSRDRKNTTLDNKRQSIPNLGRAIQRNLLHPVADFISPQSATMTRDATMFRTIRADPSQSEYFKAITGFDIGSHRPIGRTVGKDYNAPDETSRPLQDLRQEVINGINARREFFRQIGVPLKLLDSLPEESILNKTLHIIGFEKTGATWDEEIRAGYAASRGGYRDARQNSHEMLGSSGQWVRNPNYDPGAGLDTAGNLQRFSQARVEVIASRIAKAAKSSLSNTDLDTALAGVREKKKTLDNAGAGGEKTKRTKETTAEITRLEAEKSKAEAQKAPLTALEAKRQTVTSLEARIQKELTLTAASSIDTAVQDLVNRLKGQQGTEGLEEKREELKAKREADLHIEQVRITAELAAASRNTNPQSNVTIQIDSEAVLKRAETIIAPRYRRQLETLTSQIDEITSKIQSLRTLESEHKTAKTALDQAENELMSNNNIPKNLVEIKDSYYALLVTTSTLKADQLENLTVDQILAMPNIDTLLAAPPHSLPNNTPEGKTRRKEFILRAKTEHEATKIEVYNKNQKQIDAYNHIIPPRGRISPNALVTMSEQQFTSLIPTTTTAQLKTTLLTEFPLAQAEARKKLIIRYKIGVEQQLKDIQDRTDAQQKIIDSVDLTKDKETADLTTVLLTRQEPIFNQVRLIKASPQKYTDPTPVNPTDTTYSQAERTAGLPKGYYELLNVFFDYQNGTGGQGREQYFQRLNNFITPDKLTELLAESFDLSMFYPNITDALQTLNEKIIAREISCPGVYNAFKLMLIRLGKEAIAL